MVDEIPPEPPPEDEALRLKELAEEKYTAGKLKSALKYAKRAQRLHPSLDGISEMITSFKILRAAAVPVFPTSSADEVSGNPAPPDYYEILQVERFAHINTIKKQYKTLALVLHPDKNTFVASEEAFKHVGEAFRVLSDKIRRKEYDMKVRIAMQDEVAGGLSETGDVETFWTLCLTCRLLHKFDRKYLGHNLMCPNCRKSFKAVEVEEEKAAEEVNERAEEQEIVGTRVSERIRARKSGKTSGLVEGLKGWGKELRNAGFKGKRVEKALGARNENEGLRLNDRKEFRSGGMDVNDRTRAKRAKVGDDEEKITLAELWKLVKKKKKGDEENTKLMAKEKGIGTEMLHEMKNGNETEKVLEMENGKEDELLVEIENGKVDDLLLEVDNGKEDEMLVEIENGKDDELIHETENGKENELLVGIENGKEDGFLVEMEEREKEKFKGRDDEKLGENKKEISNGKVKETEMRERRVTFKSGGMEIVYKRRASKSKRISEIGNRKISRQHDLEVAQVEEPNFYDFDKDRLERSFKKGQVWAAYENIEGMPRNYALVEEIVSVNPFELRLSWLDYQSNGDEQYVDWKKKGFRIPCGKFKVSDKITVCSLKMFSHVADSERIARELYWIYPKKGSVWALYNENTLDSEERYSYSIVVLLTTYSDKHGMSVAYLVKVDGFRTVFKRREVGAGAPLWLDKDDFRLFSHQIPARKLSGDEATGLTGDCWELDPSALPPEPLSIGWGR